MDIHAQAHDLSIVDISISSFIYISQLISTPEEHTRYCIMGISYTNGVSVLELVVYFPSLFAATYLVCRHGLRTSVGFIYLILFILLRITGACCNLKSISDPSPALSIAQGICSSIGLSPLILACSGLLSRAYVFPTYSILPR